MTLWLITTTSPAANVVTYFRNNQTGLLDTNAQIAFPISSNILANGGVIPQGLPRRFTPGTNGLTTNFFDIGWYAISNVALSRVSGAAVFQVYDSSATVYDYTNLLQSGFNNFVVHNYGSNASVTFTSVTNALGFTPLTPLQTTNAITNVATNFVFSATNTIFTNWLSLYQFGSVPLSNFATLGTNHFYPRANPSNFVTATVTNDLDLMLRTLSTNGSNYAATLSTNATNFAALLSTNGSNYAATLSTNGSNYARFLATNWSWGQVTVFRPSGLESNFFASADTDAARGLNLSNAFQFSAAGDVIRLGSGTNLITSSLVLKAGCALVGNGQSSVIRATAINDAAIIATNSNIEIARLRIEANGVGVGDWTTDALSATNIVLRDLEIHSDTNSVAWKPAPGGGTGSNNIAADLFNCFITTSSNTANNAVGVEAHLGTRGLLRLFSCSVYGAIDAVLIGGTDGNCEIYGGTFASDLDAITSGGSHIYVLGAKARGLQSDLFNDDGSITASWLDARESGIQSGDVVGTNFIPGSLVVSDASRFKSTLLITNSGKATTIATNSVYTGQLSASNEVATYNLRVTNTATFGSINGNLTMSNGLYVIGNLTNGGYGVFSNLTADRALVSGAQKQLTNALASTTEVNHLVGVTGGLQTNIDARVKNNSGVLTNATAYGDFAIASTAALVFNGWNGNRAVVSDADNNLVETAVTTNEINRLVGVTGGIQTNLDGRIPTVNGSATNALTIRGNVNISTNIVVTNNATVGGYATLSNLTTARVLVSGPQQQVTNALASTTEVNHLVGVSGGVQTNLDARVKNNSGVATNLSLYGDSAVIAPGTFTISDFAGGFAVLSDPTDGHLIESSVTTNEIYRLVGVTGGLQTNIDARVRTTDGIVTNSLLVKGNASVTTNLYASSTTVTNQQTNFANMYGYGTNWSAYLVTSNKLTVGVTTYTNSPIIDFDSAKSNGVTGTLNFKALNTDGVSKTYSSIAGRIDNGNAGSEIGAMDFSIRNGSSSVITPLTLQSNGAVFVTNAVFNGGVQISSNATAGYFFMSDASGWGSWQAAPTQSTNFDSLRVTNNLTAGTITNSGGFTNGGLAVILGGITNAGALTNTGNAVFNGGIRVTNGEIVGFKFGITSNYTILSTDQYLSGSASFSNIIWPLPTGTTRGTKIEVQCRSFSGGQLVVTNTAGRMHSYINDANLFGGTNAALFDQASAGYSSATFLSDGTTNWYVFGHVSAP